MPEIVHTGDKVDVIGLTAASQILALFKYIL